MLKDGCEAFAGEVITILLLFLAISGTLILIPKESEQARVLGLNERAITKI